MSAVPRFLRGLFENSSFFASSSIIFAGSFVVNIFNYIFTLLMSRMMGVESFGEVSALLSLMLIIGVPAAALSMLMTRESASRLHTTHHSVRDLFLLLRRHTFIAAMIAWGLFLLMVPMLSGFLHIASVPFIIFSLLIPFTASSSLQSGTLQGLQEFWLLSKQNILNALIKLVGSVALVMAGFSVVGVVCALVLAQIATWIYGSIAMHRKLAITPKSKSESEQDVKTLGVIFTSLLFATLLLTLLSNMDVLLAKHFLSPLLAGQYGALSTIGKIVIYGISAVTTVLLPMVSAAHASGNGGGERVLGLSLAAIAAGSFVIFAVFALFPGFFVHALFGAAYAPIASDLAIMAFAMGFVGLSTALINYFIAIRNTSFMYLLTGSLVIETILISAYHTSLYTIASMLAISSVLLFIAMCINYQIIRARS